MLAIVGDVFLCLSPCFLMRIFGHYTLGEHWLVLAGFCIWIYKRELKSMNYLMWCILIPISALVHLYFVPMLIGVMICSYLDELLEDKKWKISALFVVIAGCLSIFLVYLFNGFDNTISIPDPNYDGLGKANSNLNTFFNSLGFSSFIKGSDSPVGYQYQGYEGFGYLGVGIIIVLLIDALLIIYNKESVFNYTKSRIKRIMPFIICGIVYWVLAIGFCITFSNHVIIEISIPDIIKPLVATFRSIGRFIWIPCYLLFFTSIIVFLKLIDYGKRLPVIQNNKIIQIIVLILICTIQIIDLKPLLVEKQKYKNNSVNYSSGIKDERWDELAKNHRYVVVTSPGMIMLDNPKANDMDYYVLNKGLYITAFNVAHAGEKFNEDAQSYYNNILSGNADPEALYWFREGEEYKYNEASKYIHCEVIDGYMLGWVE